MRVGQKFVDAFASYRYNLETPAIADRSHRQTMAQIKSRTTAATMLLLLLTIGLYGYSVWKRAQGLNMASPMAEQLKDAVANTRSKGKEAAGPKLAMEQNRIDELRDAVAASA